MAVFEHCVMIYILKHWKTSNEKKIFYLFLSRFHTKNNLLAIFLRVVHSYVKLILFDIIASYIILKINVCVFGIYVA